MKSPTATESGTLPTVKLVGGPKLAVSVFRRIDTVLWMPLATARSRSEVPRRTVFGMGQRCNSRRQLKHEAALRYFAKISAGARLRPSRLQLAV